MIFSPDMIPSIRRRSKTMTRRPVQRDPDFSFEKPCPYKPGRCYRVQVSRRWTVASLVEHRIRCEAAGPTRARAVLAYLSEPVRADWPKGRAVSTGIEITVMAVRRERLDDISAEDARREGFRFPAEFQARWCRLHKGYDPDQQVWVISFEVGDQRHKFDRDRYLRATPGMHALDAEPHQDYTEKPHLAAEKDAPIVPAADLERFAAEGYAGHARRKQTEIRRQHVRSATIRLRDAERRNHAEDYGEALRDLQNLQAQIGVAA